MTIQYDDDELDYDPIQLIEEEMAENGDPQVDIWFYEDPDNDDSDSDDDDEDD